MTPNWQVPEGLQSGKLVCNYLSHLSLLEATEGKLSFFLLIKHSVSWQRSQQKVNRTCRNNREREELLYRAAVIEHIKNTYFLHWYLKSCAAVYTQYIIILLSLCWHWHKNVCGDEFSSIWSFSGCGNYLLLFFPSFRWEECFPLFWTLTTLHLCLWVTKY